MPAAEASTAPVAKDEVLQRLYRSYGAKDIHTMSAAQKLLADYRATVIDEVVAALTERAVEFSDLAEEQGRPSLEERAQEWHQAAAVAAELKRSAAE